MDRRTLRYFLAVAEDENFNRAAQRLHIAQSALSRQIRNLEEEIGFALFFRNKHGSTLTEAGRALSQDVTEILRDLDRAVAKARRISQNQLDTLNIGLNEVSARNPTVRDLLEKFREAHPEYSFMIQLLHSTQQVRRLKETGIDIGIMFNAPNDRKLFQYHPIGMDTYNLIVPLSHPLAGAEVITIDDLRHENFIVPNRLFDPHFFSNFFGPLIAKGYEPRVHKEADSEAQIISLVSLGFGISFVHGSNRARNLANVRLCQVQDLTFRLRMSAVWRKENRSPALHAFTAFFCKPDAR